MESHGKAICCKKMKRQKAISVQMCQQLPLMSLEIDTNTHFMYYNAGKYTK